MLLSSENISQAVLAPECEKRPALFEGPVKERSLLEVCITPL